MILPPVLESAGPRAAQLLIDGLSIFCFNKNGRFWEVAYPRQTKHDLSITIQPLDNKGEPLGDIETFPVHRNIKSIDITLTDGSLPDPAQFPEGGPFDPKFVRDAPDADPHDLQWMIDVAGPELQHGNFVQLKPRDPSRPITLMRIHDSLFCNLKPERAPAVISPRTANTPDDPNSFSLGRTNTEIVGVLLANGPGEIRFESDPPRLLDIDPREYSEDQRWEIKIINDDTIAQPQHGDFLKGDLHLLYDAAIVVDGEEKDLWAEPTDPLESATDGDCHGTLFGGGGTLQPLIDG